MLFWQTSIVLRLPRTRFTFARRIEDPEWASSLASTIVQDNCTLQYDLWKFMNALWLFNFEFELVRINCSSFLKWQKHLRCSVASVFLSFCYKMTLFNPFWKLKSFFFPTFTKCKCQAIVLSETVTDFHVSEKCMNTFLKEKMYTIRATSVFPIISNFCFLRLDFWTCIIDIFFTRFL